MSVKTEGFKYIRGLYIGMSNQNSRRMAGLDGLDASEVRRNIKRFVSNCEKCGKPLGGSKTVTEDGVVCYTCFSNGEKKRSSDEDLLEGISGAFEKEGEQNDT